MGTPGVAMKDLDRLNRIHELVLLKTNLLLTEHPRKENGREVLKEVYENVPATAKSDPAHNNPNRRIPNEAEWIRVFGEVFAKLDDQVIDIGAHGAFQAVHPLLFSSKAVASYSCHRCGHCWESVNGLVEFSYRLTYRNLKHNGYVSMTLNGQKCTACHRDTSFLKPYFDEDAIQYLLEKLLLKVKEKFYLGDETLVDRLRNVELQKPVGRGAHIPELCEGCMKGICSTRALVDDTETKRQSYRSTTYVNPRTRQIKVKWTLDTSSGQNLMRLKGGPLPSPRKKNKVKKTPALNLKGSPRKVIRHVLVGSNWIKTS